MTIPPRSVAPWLCWTSTISSRSMTGMGTRPGIMYSGSLRPGSASRCVCMTFWPATAVRNSSFCFAGATKMMLLARCSGSGSAMRPGVVFLVERKSSCASAPALPRFPILPLFPNQPISWSNLPMNDCTGPKRRPGQDCRGLNLAQDISALHRLDIQGRGKVVLRLGISKGFEVIGSRPSLPPWGRYSGRICCSSAVLS